MWRFIVVFCGSIKMEKFDPISTCSPTSHDFTLPLVRYKSNMDKSLILELAPAMHKVVNYLIATGRHFRIALSLLVAAVCVALSGCQSSAEVMKPHARDLNPVRISDADVLNDWALIGMLYGQGSHKERCQCINVALQSGDLEQLGRIVPHLERDSSMRLGARLLLKRPFVENGTLRLLVLVELPELDEQDIPYSCHVCGVWIGGAILSFHPDGWSIDAASKFITVMGEYGTLGASKISIVKVGPQKHGLFVRSSSSGSSGQSHEWLSLIAEVNGAVATIMDKQLITATEEGLDKDSPSGFVLERVVDSIYELSAGDNPAYYDVLITSGEIRGRLDYGTYEGLAFQTQETKVFTFKGTKYVPKTQRKDTIVTLPSPGRIKSLMVEAFPNLLLRSQKEKDRR